MQKMTNFFIVNISMRKMILEVEYSKSMICEILKIFRRISYLGNVMFMTFLFIERTGKFMIINKEHLKEGGRLIGRQGAVKSGCIRRLLMCNAFFKDR